MESEILNGLTRSYLTKMNLSHAAHSHPRRITAHQWFAGGKRVPYNFMEKRILPEKERFDPADVLMVFERTLNKPGASWMTLLPGFPDGSFGWAKVENILKARVNDPCLFLEYVGQGESDKPEWYPYSTLERADLVESQWESKAVQSTFLITFDYSSLVALELLRRQQNSERKTKITKVLLINGGLFSDGHSHPWTTTPLLKTSVGKMGTRIAQRSKFVFNQMIKGLWSKDYRVSLSELTENYNAITRRNGAVFMSLASSFVDEHKRNSDRWDFARIYHEMKESVSFHVIGSSEDQFEPNQISLAKQRLGDHGLDIKILPGGHMTTSEYPDLLANIIHELHYTL